jgi:addiction module HigA family antidote
MSRELHDGEGPGPRVPGDVLRRDFLEPHRITLTALAAATGLSRKHVGAIVHGRAGITADTAVRFARALATPAMMWLELQAATDLAQAERELAKTAVPVLVLIPGPEEALGTDEASPATPAEAADRLLRLRRETALPPGETIASLTEFGRA